jgi:hypothetical protein
MKNEGGEVIMPWTNKPKTTALSGLLYFLPVRQTLPRPCLSQQSITNMALA